MLPSRLLPARRSARRERYISQLAAVLEAILARQRTMLYSAPKIRTNADRYSQARSTMIDKSGP